MSKSVYHVNELVTRDGQEIFRIIRVNDDGISGEFQCIFSATPVYTRGEAEVNLLERYSRITAETAPQLCAIIRENNWHLNLTPEQLSEVIRQAYQIGLKDARDGYPVNSEKAALERIYRITMDIDKQLFGGSLFKLHFKNEQVDVSRLCAGDFNMIDEALRSFGKSKG